MRLRRKMIFNELTEVESYLKWHFRFPFTIRHERKLWVIYESFTGKYIGHYKWDSRCFHWVVKVY